MANKKKKKADIKKRIANKKGVYNKKRNNANKKTNLKATTKKSSTVNNKKVTKKRSTTSKNQKKQVVKKKKINSKIRFNAKNKILNILKSTLSIIFNKYVVIGFIIVVLMLSSLYVVKKIRRRNINNDYFEKITLNEYLNLYSSKNNLEFLYLADTSCMNCDKYETNLLKLKSDLSIKIKKLEINNLNQSDLKKIENTSELFKDGIVLPTLISIQSGKVIGEINGVKEYSALKKFVDDTKKTTNYSFNIISVDKFVSLLSSKEKVIIYIGNSNDIKCSEYSKLLNNVSNKLNLKVNYLNTVDINSEEDWNKLKNADNMFKKNWFVPVTIIVKNGKIKSYKMEIMNENDLNKFLNQ